MSWLRNAPGAASLGSMQGWCASQMDCDQMPASMVPDLTDPATVGCLLAMLGDLGIVFTSWLQIEGPRHTAVVDLYPHGGSGVGVSAMSATLGEAVARALLACWGRE